MASVHAKFSTKVHAPVAPHAQTMREDRDRDRDLYGVPEHDSPRRNPRSDEGPRWPYDDWPLPFASFWTSLLATALCYPAHALLVTLAGVTLGLWVGVRLDRWLRKHPERGGRRVRWVLGVV